jgi:hypothetical protein
MKGYIMTLKEARATRLYLNRKHKRRKYEGQRPTYPYRHAHNVANRHYVQAQLDAGAEDIADKAHHGAWRWDYD